MALYNVFIDQNGKPLAIKQGYNFFAMIFTYIWALFSKLWEKAVILIFISTGLNALFNTADGLFNKTQNIIFYYVELVSLALIFFVLYYVGKHGNQWRLDNSLQKGYKHLGIVEAESKEDSISKLVK